MQDLFEDYADILASDTSKAEKIIERITIKKIKSMIEGKRSENRLVMGELDSDTLYNLIEASEKKTDQ